MLTYEAAQQRYLDQSDALDAADAGVRAAAARYKATRTIGRPEVDIEAQVLDFQKTLFLPLGPMSEVGEVFGLSDPLQFRIRELVSRPIVTATLPLYAGGRMDAARIGVKSQPAIEEAARDTTTAEALAGVARAYFGRQLAVQARDVRSDLVGRMEQLVAGARAAALPRLIKNPNSPPQTSPMHFSELSQRRFGGGILPHHIFNPILHVFIGRQGRVLK